MAPPWISQSKTIDLYRAAHQQHPSRHSSYGFVAPAAQPQMTISPGAFAAACARACSLESASPRVIQAIAKSTQELLYAFIDDDPPDPFRILVEATDLIDAKFVGLAHDIGVAMTDLYLERLGFHWRANGKSVIKSGPVPDMFYDNGLAGSSGQIDVVAAEAKGSVRKNGTVGQMDTETGAGYVRQVVPHLGKTYSTTYGSLRVAHGYAVGTVAPAGGPDSHFCVHEPVAVGSTDAASQDLPVPAGPAPATAIALSHYKGLLSLIGATEMSRDISLAQGEQPVSEVPPRDEWVPVVIAGETFLTTDATPYLRVNDDNLLVPAISRRVVSAIRDELESMRRGDVRARLPLPVLGPDFMMEVGASDPLQYAFGDGFAVVPIEKFEALPRKLLRISRGGGGSNVAVGMEAASGWASLETTEVAEGGQTESYSIQMYDEEEAENENAERHIVISRWE